MGRVYSNTSMYSLFLKTESTLTVNTLLVPFVPKWKTMAENWLNNLLEIKEFIEAFLASEAEEYVVLDKSLGCFSCCSELKQK